LEEKITKQEDIIEQQNTTQIESEGFTDIPKTPKKLSYLNRDGYGKSLRIDRF